MTLLYTAIEVNAGIQERLQLDIDLLKAANITPVLATVRIGENEADISYEKGAAKRMESLNLNIRHIRLPENSSQETVIHELKKLAADNEVHGILLFQPLPRHLNEFLIKNTIPPEKDVDCATLSNLGAVVSDSRDCYPYCAPAAVLELLDHYGIELKGKHVVIVGSGLVVGKPLSMMLVNRLATVTLCNIYTKDIPSFTREADILVSACGVAGLITDKYVKESQILIDVGTSVKDGKLRGDVNMELVEHIVYAVTPTPGGVSGITNTILAKHVVQAAKRIANLA
jgi:methylenetetrahydrofolate dehydrogenase (NADP+)/methenyltetrahydrofolate cyclohydrolase